MTPTIQPALLDLFQRIVDPDESLPDTERLRRAVNAMRAHGARLAGEQAALLASRRAAAPQPDPGGWTAYRDPTGDLAVRNLLRGPR